MPLTDPFLGPSYNFCGENVNFLTPSNHFSSISLTETTRVAEEMKHLAGLALVLFPPQASKQEQGYSSPEWNQKWERGFLPPLEASWTKTTFRGDLHWANRWTPAAGSACDFAIPPEHQHLKIETPNFCFLLDMSNHLVLNSGGWRQPRLVDRHIGDTKGWFQLEPEVLHVKKTNKQQYLFPSISAKEMLWPPCTCEYLPLILVWPAQLLTAVSPGPVWAFTHRNNTTQRRAPVRGAGMVPRHTQLLLLWPTCLPECVVLLDIWVPKT